MKKDRFLLWRRMMKPQRCCANITRVFESEAEEGRYPPSDHSPSCPNFKRERFIRIRMADGAVLVCEPKAADDIIKSELGEQGVAQVVGEVILTRDQYEKMEEYEP